MSKGNPIPKNLDASIKQAIRKVRGTLRHNGLAYLFMKPCGTLESSCRENRIVGQLIGTYTQGVPWEMVVEDIRAI